MAKKITKENIRSKNLFDEDGNLNWSFLRSDMVIDMDDPRYKIKLSGYYDAVVIKVERRLSHKPNDVDDKYAVEDLYLILSAIYDFIQLDKAEKMKMYKKLK
jgi:hypothetical protein